MEKVLAVDNSVVRTGSTFCTTKVTWPCCFDWILKPDDGEKKTLFCRKVCMYMPRPTSTARSGELERSLVLMVSTLLSRREPPTVRRVILKNDERDGSSGSTRLRFTSCKSLSS
jgi:hypothetical protein